MQFNIYIIAAKNKKMESQHTYNITQTSRHDIDR